MHGFPSAPQGAPNPQPTGQNPQLSVTPFSGFPAPGWREAAAGTQSGPTEGIPRLRDREASSLGALLSHSDPGNATPPSLLGKTSSPGNSGRDPLSCCWEAFGQPPGTAGAREGARDVHTVSDTTPGAVSLDADLVKEETLPSAIHQPSTWLFRLTKTGRP